MSKETENSAHDNLKTLNTYEMILTYQKVAQDKDINEIIQHCHDVENRCECFVNLKRCEILIIRLLHLTIKIAFNLTKC